MFPILSQGQLADLHAAEVSKVSFSLSTSSTCVHIGGVGRKLTYELFTNGMVAILLVLGFWAKNAYWFILLDCILIEVMKHYANDVSHFLEGFFAPLFL